ncbi:hypothetical protein MRBBS_3780 [Marinobacter sp. BSs20148]|nr:hypothetical protein MRBBS_3780 [Marinobacter sp. BSs20148]
MWLLYLFLWACAFLYGDGTFLNRYGDTGYAFRCRHFAGFIISNVGLDCDDRCHRLWLHRC